MSVCFVSLATLGGLGGVALGRLGNLAQREPPSLRDAAFDFSFVVVAATIAVLGGRLAV